MSTELGLAVIERGQVVALSQQAVSIAEMQSRSVLIRQVMANVLEEGKDYGKIPGTDKPTLYKPGAEKLCLTFNLATQDPVIEDLSTGDAVRYRVRLPIEAPNGRIVAVGVGECSSDEEKYRWRRPVCDEEFDATEPALRRLKWFRGKAGNSNYQGKQLRTSPADVANTILKMAHKRAYVGATLLATGASSVFNQDAEDFAEELREHVIGDEAGAPEPPPRTVRRASEAKSAAAPPPGQSDSKATPALKVKDVRVFGKNQDNYAVTLIGHPIEYTTRDGIVAAELEKFKGTDHLVRLSFEVNKAGDKTYHNILRFDVVDAPASAPLAAGDIPFGR